MKKSVNDDDDRAILPPGWNAFTTLLQLSFSVSHFNLLMHLHLQKFQAVANSDENVVHIVKYVISHI